MISSENTDRLEHSDLKSTLRYLKPLRGKESRERVDAIFADVA